MKKGSLSSDLFSYKGDPYLKFSDNNYIFAVKDEDFADRNIVPILYFDNGKINDIDEYDMVKIVTVPNTKVDKPMSRFNLNQIIKVSFGNIIDNDRHLYNTNLPKCKTFDSNINSADKNDFIEIFDGEIDESKSRIKIFEPFLESLILEVYAENNTPILIKTKDRIVGPFKILEKDREGYYVVEKNLWKTFGEYSIEETTYIEFLANDIERKIHLPSINKLNLVKQLDFKDDNELIKEFKQKIVDSDESVDKKALEELVLLLKKTTKIKSVDNFLNENLRLKELIQNTEDITISELELSKLIPEIKTISNEIEILQNRESELKSFLEKTSEKKVEIEQEIIEKEEKLQSLKKELEDISKTKEEEYLKVKIDLESEITKLTDQKNNIEESIKKETNEKSLQLKDLVNKIDKLRKEKDDFEFTITELKQENRRIQRDSQEELINLFKHKKYFDFLSGRDLSEFDQKEEKKFITFKTDSTFQNYLEFKKELISVLNKTGRMFEPHFIDNLLLSIHQNTLTVFAGLPGTGKTSLARLLTQILTPKERIAEVSVSRGWSSQKDLIGFQNPLTNKFHNAPNKVYEILTQLDYESKNNCFLDSPFAYIILDEANLSPIEHYWSTFYNLTDSIANHNSSLKISLGNSHELEYQNNLRFIATINYDQTTEALSPRVLDRANIIQIPSSNFNINEISINEVQSLNLSYQKCKEFFKLVDFENEKKNIELKEDFNSLFNEIKKKFKALRVSISPRVEISIKRYCDVAKDWMKENSRPLDYCVAQRLLPLINLQGDVAKNNLEELRDLFKENDLKKSEEILNKILETGDEESIFEGNYNYFLTLSYA